MAPRVQLFPSSGGSEGGSRALPHPLLCPDQAMLPLLPAPPRRQAAGNSSRRGARCCARLLALSSTGVSLPNTELG